MRGIITAIGVGVVAIAGVATLIWVRYRVKQAQTNRHRNEAKPNYFVNENGGVAAEECCICMADMSMNERLAYLPCGHLMHAGCIEMWGRYDASCPLCRRGFNPAQI